MTDLADALRDGSLRAGELTARLGVSPATLMRRVRAAGAAVVRIGASHATRYGLRRELPGLGASEVPLFRIDASGRAIPVGRLVFMAGEESAWLPAGAVFDGLPPEIADMQPSGFMGRGFTRRFPELPVPERVDDWSDPHTVIALARRGEDLPGNLVLGDESIARWFEHAPPAVTREDYPALAEAATAGDIRGSSAGGDRPKFGVFADGRHVLVKYAGGEGPVAERWRDLLALEDIALAVLRGLDPATAVDAQLIDTATHRFLEVERFDRIGERGRRAVITLAAAHARATDTWAQAARSMAEAGMLSHDDARTLQLLDAFAQLIANTDRHHYNVALFPELGDGERTAATARRYVLAPAFDQVPMLYAPTGGGQLPERAFARAAPAGDTWNVWEDAIALGSEFWKRAASDARVGERMRAVALANAGIVGRRAG